MCFLTFFASIVLKAKNIIEYENRIILFWKHPWSMNQFILEKVAYGQYSFFSPVVEV